MRIGIIAALPGELKQLVNTGFKRVPGIQPHARKWTMVMDEDVWIAACAGMGADAACRAFAEAEVDGKLDMVLSVGWAGSLTDEWVSGGVGIPSTVVDALTGERFVLGGGERPCAVLVTAARFADADEKRRLAEAYGGALVDMEAATIVRLARIREIPVCCLKAESDGIGKGLPDFNLFFDQSGQMDMALFLRYVCVRPKFWKALVQLRKASANGANNLASAILTLLTGPKDFSEVNRTGNVDW